MGDGLDDLQFICEHHNIMRKMVKSDCKWVESIRLVLKLIVYLIIFFYLRGVCLKCLSDWCLWPNVLGNKWKNLNNFGGDCISSSICGPICGQMKTCAYVVFCTERTLKERLAAPTFD